MEGEHTRKHLRTSPEESNVQVILSNTIADVSSPPPGLNTDVLPIDRDNVLRLMVLFSSAIEPAEPTRQWSVKSVISNADGPNTVQGYNCYFTGYKGVVTAADMTKFQQAHSDDVSYVGADLTFVSDDQAYAGAIVMCVNSSSWKARKAAEAAQMAQKPVTAIHIEDAKLAAAANGGSNSAAAAVAVAGVTGLESTVPVCASTDVPSLQHHSSLATTLADALPRRTSVMLQQPTKKRKGFVNSLVSLVGLQEGDDDE